MSLTTYVCYGELCHNINIYTEVGKQVKVGGLHGCLMSIWVVTVILEYLSIY